MSNYNPLSWNEHLSLRKILKKISIAISGHSDLILTLRYEILKFVDFRRLVF